MRFYKLFISVLVMMLVGLCYCTASAQKVHEKVKLNTKLHKSNNIKEAQPSTPVAKPSQDEDEVLTSAAHMPEFPGGTSALINFISENLRYPQAAIANKIQGKVVVQFVITKYGNVGQVKVARGVDPDLDREAVRVCRMLPPFKPGINSKGEPVNVWYTLSINFKL